MYTDVFTHIVHQKTEAHDVDCSFGQSVDCIIPTKFTYIGNGLPVFIWGNLIKGVVGVKKAQDEEKSLYFLEKWKENTSEKYNAVIG